MRYAVVVEKAENNYSAYVPDLPGCIATGYTVEEAEREIREAIRNFTHFYAAFGSARLVLC
jgi:predicted RNase H-like HicB family nuclease